jgi:ABC-2 type transport system permease protein
VTATDLRVPIPQGRPRSGMTLLRLEVARMLRSHRGLLVVGVHVLFGIIGPLTARYLDVLLEQVGGGMTVTVPDPRPVDGLVQYVSNVSQIGVLVVVVVAAGALAFDGHPERAAFLRARVARPGRLLVAPYLVTTAVAVLAWTVGTAVAAGLSAALLGPLPLGAVVAGTAFGALYLAFAVAVVALIASALRTQLGTVLAALVTLVALPVLATVGALRPWLPSELLTAVLAVTEGAPVTEFLRPTLVAVAASAGALLLAARRLEAREV